MTPIIFTVYGEAQSKGSARAFVPKGWTRPIITTTNKNLKQWERQIASAAQVYAGTLLTGPLMVDIAFYLPRPKSIGSKAVAHTKRPDLDKLVRGATDALTNVLWKDDAQIVSLHATKAYTSRAAEGPHARFQIMEYQ